MKTKSLKQAVILLFALFSILFAKCSGGDKFIGKWVSDTYSSETLTISKNGNNFMVVYSSGATFFGSISEAPSRYVTQYKDGALVEIGGGASITYIEKQNKLLFRSRYYSKSGR